MPAPGNIAIVDYSNEPSSFRPNLSSTATPAVNLASLETIIAAAFNNALILGAPGKETVSYWQQTAIAGPAAAGAQRELKWLITYQDVSQYLDPPTNSVLNPYYGRYFTHELPTANNGLLAAGTDILPLTDAAATAFIAAMQADAKSPVGGTIVISEIRLVGRNL